MSEPDLLPFAVIAADIEGFSKHVPLRQAELRADFLDLFHRALADARVDLVPPGLRDRGDGGFGLVAPAVARAPLTADFPRRLAIELRRRGAGPDGRNRLRLRLVLHHGQARPHRADWVGPVVDTAARILDAEAGRRLLATTPEADLVLLLSDEMYRDTVQLREADLDPADFTPGRIPVGTKGAGTAFWASMLGQSQFRPSPTALAAAGLEPRAAGDRRSETGEGEDVAAPDHRTPPDGRAQTGGRYVHDNSGVVAMGDGGIAIGKNVGSSPFRNR
jgi:class 3 adenylate cyclase